MTTKHFLDKLHELNLRWNRTITLGILDEPIGPVFCNFAKHFRTYREYVQNFSNSDIELSKLLKKSRNRKQRKQNDKFKQLVRLVFKDTSKFTINSLSKHMFD